MDLDIDFSKPRRKIPLYIALVLVFILFCVSTPTFDEIQEVSCNYIEDLSKFWYNDIGLSVSFVDTASDWLGFYIFDYALVVYLVLVNDKYFALVQIIGIRCKGSISQTLKILFQDNRPAWSCDNLEIGYCRNSYGLTATHVWEGTVCYLSIIYFFFIHNGYFNKKFKRNIPMQILRYLGIAICILCIWLVHQTRLILGAHYLYQDYYGFLLGCVYFYCLYYFFYPLVMNGGSLLKFQNFWKTQVVIFVILTCIVWMTYTAAQIGKTIPDGCIANFFTYCGATTVSEIFDEFVNFDVYDAIFFYSSWMLAWFLPFKSLFPGGHFWIWSLIGLPIGTVCTYLAVQNYVMNWISWDTTGLFIVGYYVYAIWVAVFEGLPFVYYLVAWRLFSKEYKQKTDIQAGFLR